MQRAPLHPAAQVQVSGAVQDPPFAHPGEHTGTSNKKGYCEA